MYDTIVLGLGGMGSATAYQLARRGQRVLGLEQFSLGHDRGSSHGHSRVIRQAYFEHPDYVPLLLRAYELWRRLEAESGESLLTITGGLMIGKRDSEVVCGSLASAQLHRLDHELLDAGEIRRRFPLFEPSNEYVAVFERQAGVVRPEAAIAAHCRLAHRHGAELRFNEHVVTWRSEGDEVCVTTQKETYRAKQLVITAGAWAPAMFQLELPLVVTRQILFWFEPTCHRSMYAPNRFPIYIWQIESGSEFYGFPATEFPGEPRGVKVAYFYRPNRVSPDEPLEGASELDLHQMRDAISDKIPTLNGRLIHSASCLYTETPDHHFVIGVHPKAENVLLASPCSGHGYKFCSVIGEILADLVETGESTYSTELFRMGRF